MPNFEIEDEREQSSFAARRARKNGKKGRIFLLLLAWVSGAIAAVVAANAIIQHVKSNETNRLAPARSAPVDYDR